MRCQNCGFNNDETVKVCEKCNANFSMRNEFFEMGGPKKTSFSSCLTNFFSYSILLILILVTIAAVGAFNCIYRIPEIPEKEYPPIITNVWENVLEMQADKCVDIGFAQDR